MKRYLPYLIVLPIGLAFYACSSSKSDDNSNPSPDDPGGTSPSDNNPDGSAAANPVDLNANPIDGIQPAKAVLETDAYTDGPTWHVGQQVLFFTTPLGTGALYRMRTDGSTKKVSDGDPTLGVPIGTAVDDAGNLYIVNTFSLTKSSADPDAGAPTVIANGFMNGTVQTKFDSLKAAVVRKDGTIYVTDPGYASTDPNGPTQNRIYLITPDNTVTVADSFDDIPRPTGIALNPDQTELYVSFTEPTTGTLPYVRKYHLNDDGTFGESQVWVSMDAETSAPDGIAVDQAGNVFVAAAEGVEVFKSDGTKIGVVAVPEQPTGLAFGGPNLTSLYITTQVSKIWEVDVNVPGIAQ
ncbi:MAG: SMP-30/gluconolactonase/LRE family protein [Polyangiaceae bacterium]|nr:SMP-30/gluconolactonase/LRE family protein [Polyangiaceae bacterium]